MGEKQITGGFALMAVKKLNGARLRTPALLRVETNAMGRGTIDANQQLVDVLIAGLLGIDNQLTGLHGFLLHPAHPIIFPLHALARRQNVNWIQAIQHHRVLIGMRLLPLIRQRLRMRPVMDPARMQRGHARP